MMVHRLIPDNNLYTSLWMGVLLGISFPPFPAFFAILILPALVLALELCRRTSGTRELMAISYPGFVVFNVISTYWLTFATVPGGVAAILANAVLMTFPLALIRAVILTPAPIVLRALGSASVWVLYEMLHHRWDLAWPWLTLGNAWSVLPVLIQYISVTGVLGVSFWLVYTAVISHQLLIPTAPLQPVVRSGRERIMRRMLAGSVVLLPLVSIVQFFTWNDAPAGTIEVVAAQPNFDSYLPLAGYPDVYEPLDEIIALSEAASTPNTVLWLWPENAIMASIHENSTRFPNRELPDLAAEKNIVLVGGANYYRYYAPGDTLPGFARSDGVGGFYNIYNAALGYAPGKPVVVYKKMSLVPIVERFPFIYTLSKIPIPGWSWDDASGFARGYDAVNFNAGGVFFPALVCYDSVFPARVREFAVQQAGFLSVITNDGWWGNTSGHVQHFEFARLRAIEHRKAVVRSANNGTSGMLRADGTVHSRTEYWTKTALNLQVPVYTKPTFYTRFGDMPVLFLCLFGIIMLVPVLLKKQ